MALNIKDLSASLIAEDFSVLRNITKEQLSHIDTKGKTIFHIASCAHICGIIPKIMELGCECINTPDKSGRTPLHYAANCGNVNVIKDLMKYGCNSINDGNKDGIRAIHEAANNGHITTVQTLYEYGASLEVTTAYGNTPMHYAAWKGHSDVIQFLYLSCPSTARQTNNDHYLPLHCAIQYGRAAAVKMLLDIDGLSTEHWFEETFSPAHQAILYSHVDILNIIIAYDKDQIRSISSTSETLPNYAIKHDKMDIFKRLVEIDCSILDFYSRNGSQPIHYAAWLGRLSYVEYILSIDKKYINVMHNPEKIPKIIPWKGLPSHFAAMASHIDVLNYLYNVDPGVVKNRDNYNRTPLEIAISDGKINIIQSMMSIGFFFDNDSRYTYVIYDVVSKGNIDMVDQLIQWGVDIHKKTQNTHTNGLHAAVLNSTPAMVEKMLSLNIVDEPNYQGDFAIHMAVMSGNIDKVKLLLNSKGIDQKNNKGQIPMELAIQEGHTDIVVVLAQVQNVKTLVFGDGLTCLHLAARHGNPEMIQALVDLGCRVDSLDVNRVTPLYDAIHSNKYSNVKTLIELGADQRKPCAQLMYPIHKAVLNRAADIVELLLSVDISIKNIPNKDGHTSMHMASEGGDINVVEILCNYGADMNVITDLSETPMHLAARYGHMEVIKLMISRGCTTIDFLNNLTGTPMHEAAARGHHQTVELLFRLGSKSIDTPNFGYNTPMCLAARDGHIEVIKILYRLGSTSINTVKVMFQMGNIHNTDARKLVSVLGAFRTSDGKLYGATEQQIIDAHNDIFFKDSLLKSLLICC